MIKLYDKKLNSLDALRQELALKKQEEQSYFNNILGTDNQQSSKANVNPSDDSDTIWSEMLGIGMDLLTSKGLSNKLMVLAMPALRLAGRKIEKNILKSLATEFAIGYLKWKALELGTKALFSFIDARLEKKKED